MSLYQAADGILDTYVTWQDLELDLQNTLGTKATFGDKKKATNISDLKGFLSRIACVHPDWQNVEEGAELPEVFVVKMSSQLALINLSKMMKVHGDDGFSDEKLQSLGKLVREAHNREVENYKLLQRFNHPDIPYTKVYSLKPFNDKHDLKGYMILDFIPNVHSIEMFRSIPSDDLISVVRGVATFSALGETLTPEEKNFTMGPDYLEALFFEFITEESLQKSFEKLQSVLIDYKEDTEKVIEIFQKCKSLVKKYATLSDELGFKLILNHGDVWQANMIHSLGENGRLKLEAIIDWQTVARMPPGMDMARLLVGCLSGKDRREHGPSLLKLYHQTFVDVLGREVFSFQELQDSYNLFFTMTAMMLLPAFPTFLEALDLPEEEKSKAEKDLMEKMVALMEDVIAVHKINSEKFPEFLEV